MLHILVIVREIEKIEFIYELHRRLLCLGLNLGEVQVDISTSIWIKCDSMLFYRVRSGGGSALSLKNIRMCQHDDTLISYHSITGYLWLII